MQPVLETVSTPKKVEAEDPHLTSNCITEVEVESSQQTVASGATDLLTHQLEMFSSRKSSAHERRDHFNLTSAYHQAQAVRNVPVSRPSKTPMRATTALQKKSATPVREKLARPVVLKAKITTKAKSLALAFKDVNLHVFADIARIKKPSKAALITGQLLSSFVLLMREAYNPRAVPNVELQDWASIL